MTYALQHDPQGAPVLVTDRLVLRKPRDEDWAPMAAFWSSERSRMMGGPWDAATLRVELDDLYAQWDVHGFSLFTPVLDGRPIGGIGPFYPASHPEPELGWSLWDVADEGKGLAHEAAVAARDWFFATSGHRTAVSYTHVENAASHRLCERMGAVVDDTAPCPYPPPVRVYRHFARGTA